MIVFIELWRSYPDGAPVPGRDIAPYLTSLKFSHGADEDAGDLNCALFVAANETVGNFRVFGMQAKAFGRFKDAF